MKAIKRNKHTHGRRSLSVPMHVYIALAIPERAKKNLGLKARKRLLRQLQVLAQDLRTLSNLLADNSDKIAGASVKSTGDSIDLVPGLEIVSEGDGTKLTFQEQGRASLSFFSQDTVLNAKPDDEEHQALVKKKLHVIESINRKLSYVLSAKDTCSCAEGEGRSWLTHSEVRASDLLALLEDCRRNSQPQPRCTIGVHGRKILSALSLIVKDLIEEMIAGKAK